MPRPGRKTIDQPKGLVTIYKSIYDKNADELELKEGITSFQGFITKLLSKLLLTGKIPDDLGKYLKLSPEELSDLLNQDQEE